MPKEKLASFMMENYNLEVDVDELFGAYSESELTLKHFETFLAVKAGI